MRDLFPAEVQIFLFFSACLVSVAHPLPVQCLPGAFIRGYIPVEVILRPVSDHFSVMLKLRMNGAVPPLTHTTTLYGC